MGIMSIDKKTHTRVRIRGHSGNVGCMTSAWADEVQKIQSHRDELRDRATKMFCGFRKVARHMTYNQTKEVAGIKLDGSELMKQSYLRMVHDEYFWKTLETYQVKKITRWSRHEFGAMSGDLFAIEDGDQGIVIGWVGGHICIAILWPDGYEICIAAVRDTNFHIREKDITKKISWISKV